VFTIAATGSAGSINSNYDIFAATSVRTVGGANVSNLISYSTSSASAVTVDLNSQLTINPFFQWGASSQGNNIQFNNVLVEFLN
jgi:2-keto-3-deoxy-6-phosphogluconate aldolase